MAVEQRTVRYELSHFMVKNLKYNPETVDKEKNKTDREIHLRRYAELLVKCRGLLNSHQRDWDDVIQPSSELDEQRAAYEARRFDWDVARLDVIYRWSRNLLNPEEKQTVIYCRRVLENPPPIFQSILKRRMLEQRMLDRKFHDLGGAIDGK